MHSQFLSIWSDQPETLYVYPSVLPWRYQHPSSSEGPSQYELNLSCLQLWFYLLCAGENDITPWVVGLNAVFGRKRSEINLRHLQRLCFPLLPFWQTVSTWKHDSFGSCLNKPAVMKQMCIQFTFLPVTWLLCCCIQLLHVWLFVCCLSTSEMLVL